MSSTLVERLGKEPQRASVIADCVALIDVQVKQKGFIVKSAYSTVKAFKKNVVPELVDGLLDEWLAKLDPHHDRWASAKPSTFTEFLVARSGDVAEDLLSVTDVHAEHSKHSTLKKIYSRLRESAKRNVVEAIPELGKLLEKHLDGAQPSAAPTAP